MSEINWEANIIEQDLIHQIAGRVFELIENSGGNPDLISIEMTITAAHLNGCPLDLNKFLAFDDFNLMHDFTGLENHIDTKTGKVSARFLPRCHA